MYFQFTVACLHIDQLYILVLSFNLYFLLTMATNSFVEQCIPSTIVIHNVYFSLIDMNTGVTLPGQDQPGVAFLLETIVHFLR